MGHLHFKKELHETGEPCDMKVSRTVRRGGYGVHFTVEHSVPTLHILSAANRGVGFHSLYLQSSVVEKQSIYRP